MKTTSVKNIGLFIDLQNVSSFPQFAKLLLDFAQSKGNVVSKKIYYNSLCAGQNSTKDKLQNQGFQCIDVPCPLKNSADNQLIADCIQAVNSDSDRCPDTVILCSGDGDFVSLVNNLHKLGKTVIIFAQRGNAKQSLQQSVNDFYYLDQLPVPDLVENKSHHNSSAISYEDAINFLQKAIEMAISTGKPTVLSYIDKLMRKLSASYKGVACIYKNDGQPFKKFSKFVAAAAKDGKVQLKNQELFLI